MSLRLASLVTMAALLAAGCGAGAAAPIVIKASSSSAASEPQVLALQRFGAELRSRTGGRIGVEVYPNNSLGNEREAIELAIIGAIELVCPSNAPLTTFVPELTVFELPYLFSDRAHMYRILDGPVGRRFEEPLRRRGLRLLGYFEAGLRHVMTRDRDVRTPADMQGLKIRTMENRLHLRTFEAFGASAVPMAYAELYTALEQGVIDGAEAANSNYYSKRFFEIAPHWAQIGWMYLVSPLVMSERFYQELSPDDRAAVHAAAAAAIAWERQEYQRQEDRAFARLREAGIRITEPDRTLFREAARRVWRNAADQVPAELLQAIVNDGEGGARD